MRGLLILAYTVGTAGPALAFAAGGLCLPAFACVAIHAGGLVGITRMDRRSEARADRGDG